MKATLPRVLLGLSWLALLGLFGFLTHESRWTVASGDRFIYLQWAALWLPYLAAAGAVWWGRLSPRPLLLLLMTLPFYASAMVGEPPEHVVDLGEGRSQVFSGWFSNDHHRFLLDGELLSEGENPYHVIPEDVADARPRHAPFVNHPDLPTFYSPLAEAWFLAISLSGLGWRGIILGNAISNALSIFLLASLLARRGKGNLPLLLFALNPLVLLESTLGLHFDPVVALTLLLTVWCLETGRRTGAAACWAAAVGFKLFPLVLLPVILRKTGWRRTLAAVAGLAVLHIPFANADTLRVYLVFSSMSVNPSPLAALLPGVLRIAALLGVVFWFTYRPGRNGAFVVYPVLALLLLSPTVHPWYVLWVLPFAILSLRARWPVLGWSFLAFFGYSVLLEYFEGGLWRPASPLTYVLWILLLFCFSVVAYLRHGIRHRLGVLLLAWPVVPLLVLAYHFEAARFASKWAASFPYLHWHFGHPPYAPWGLRVLAIWPVRLLSGATGGNPVLCGYVLLGVGHLAAIFLLHRMVGRKVLLYLAAPYFWLLPWGQIAGPVTGPPLPAWHFSQFSEAVYLPLAFGAILAVRRGARSLVVLGLLVLLLATKESAFLLVMALFVVRSGFSLRTVLPSAALGIGYVLVLRFGGLEYPSGVPPLLPGLDPARIVENGWALIAAGAWLLLLAGALSRGTTRENALVLGFYGAVLLAFSMFWETRLWLVALPLVLEGGPATSREE